VQGLCGGALAKQTQRQPSSGTSAVTNRRNPPLGSASVEKVCLLDCRMSKPRANCCRDTREAFSSTWLSSRFRCPHRLE
jgi:hypothetical protein